MTPARYGELEIGLHRSQPGIYEVELRVTDPGNDAEIAPARGQARISLPDLEQLGQRLRPDGYGARLTDDLFSDQAIREFWLKNKASFESRGLMLRLRILIDPSAPELHGLRWELLRDPETKRPLATSERILFSRFMLSRDSRAVKLRPKTQLKARIAVSAPSDIVKRGLAAVDYDGELARARAGLCGIDAPAFEKHEPVTLNRLLDGLRQGVDILYLVCHGGIPQGLEACLYLQNDEGQTQVVPARELARRIQELQEVPRLIVLASCDSAGNGDGDSAQSALAPLLAEAGVPAVLAMQGRISMETVKRAMPVFFRELLKDGQIDRALAVARGEVRDQPDHWMPALFMRLKNGRIWYLGFGGDETNDRLPWDSLCTSVHRGDLVPVIGPDLAEHIFGSSREFAAGLVAAARQQGPALAVSATADGAQIAQRIATQSGDATLQTLIERLLYERLLEKAQALNLPTDADSSQLMSRLVDRLTADPDEPFRILSQLKVKVYINGASDPLLKLFLKKSGKRPAELFSDWRTASTVDDERLSEAANTLCEALDRTAGAPYQDVVMRWRAGLRLPGESSAPRSLEFAADRLIDMLRDEKHQATPKPAAAVARSWRATLEPPSDTPSHPLPFETPLIYYAFGTSRYKDTCVVTEDDFFDHLISSTKNNLMPGIVADKLVAGSLLFLGFPLDDWKFRILFRTIMSKDGNRLLRSGKYYHVGVQVDSEDYTPDEAGRIREFLKQYFGKAANINIFWGSAAEFLREFRDRLKTFPAPPPEAAPTQGDW